MAGTLLVYGACQARSVATARDSGNGSGVVDARNAVGAARADAQTVGLWESRDAANADATSAVVGVDAQPALSREHQLRAIPAWDAVIDRAYYLGRRKQKAVIVGLWGGPIPPAEVVQPESGSATGATAPLVKSPSFWLHDESIEGGALGVSVRLPTNDSIPAVGARVAVTGAWALDEKRWYWRATAFEVLPPSARAVTSSSPPGSPSVAGNAGLPGLPIAASSAPAGTRQVSFARGEEWIYFQVVAVPKRPGDGWKIANELGDSPVGVILLPGERRSFGGLEMRSPEERWNLRRGVTYWLRIGALTFGQSGEPWAAVARSAPVRDL